MKQIVIFTLLLLTAVTTNAQTKKDFSKLHWLNGAWKSTDNKPGQTGIETWRKNSATEMTGLGVTLKGKDTLFVENLQLIVKDNAIYYMARLGKNKTAVPFKLTQITATSFICENPTHDFPKKISYQLVGNHIRASISGDGKREEFEFVKD